MIIHHIEMDNIRARIQNGLHVVTKPGEIG